LNLIWFNSGSRHYSGQTWLAMQLWPGEERHLNEGSDLG
jgi:hypothetical protein